MWMQLVIKQNITKLFKICFQNTSMENLQQLKSILVCTYSLQYKSTLKTCFLRYSAYNRQEKFPKSKVK